MSAFQKKSFATMQFIQCEIDFDYISERDFSINPPPQVTEIWVARGSNDSNMLVSKIAHWTQSESDGSLFFATAA